MNVSLPQHLVQPVEKCGNPADIVREAYLVAEDGILDKN
jgi:hypothetical protein